MHMCVMHIAFYHKVFTHFIEAWIKTDIWHDLDSDGKGEKQLQSTVSFNLVS